jgi:hypothetical protein
VVSQESFTKILFEPEQIQLGVLTNQGGRKTSPKETFTAQQVEQKIAEALAEREREQIKAELRKFIEIHDTAIQAATVELKATQEHSQKMA